jgi:hypothetical protein
MSMPNRAYVALWIALAGAAAACDTVQLLAPTGSTVTLTTASAVVPTGGTTQVTAFVYESSGTPVQNGTTVRFSTNLGRVDPVETQTRNGYAAATFSAGDVSGIADVRAWSGATGGAGGEGENASATNVVQISVGAAAVETVLVGANPGSVPATGGTVELLATVVGANGRELSNVFVNFTSTEGQLGSARVPTDANGQARTTLTTNLTSQVTAAAGSKSAQVTVTRRDPALSVIPGLTASAATPVVGAGQSWTFTATLTPANDPTSQPVVYDWDFGDGSTATTNGNITSHVYTSGANTPRVVRVTITLTNGQTLVATTQILLGSF